MGQELAYEMGLIPGDQLTFISPTETEGPLESVPRLKRYVIEGVYHSGLPEAGAAYGVCDEGAVRSFLRRQNAVSEWEISVKDFENAPAIAREAQKLAPQFKVQDWIQLNAHLFASLRLERISMFIILGVHHYRGFLQYRHDADFDGAGEKARDLDHEGDGRASRPGRGDLFVRGILIGGLGVGGGLLLGGLLCSILRRYEFITLPDIYYDRTLPVTFDPRYYVLVAVCAVMIVLAACRSEPQSCAS